MMKMMKMMKMRKMRKIIEIMNKKIIQEINNFQVEELIIDIKIKK